jgi:hypothetical protein
MKVMAGSISAPDINPDRNGLVQCMVSITSSNLFFEVREFFIVKFS